MKEKDELVDINENNEFEQIVRVLREKRDTKEFFGTIAFILRLPRKPIVGLRKSLCRIGDLGVLEFSLTN